MDNQLILIILSIASYLNQYYQPADDMILTTEQLPTIGD